MFGIRRKKRAKERPPVPPAAPNPPLDRTMRLMFKQQLYEASRTLGEQLGRRPHPPPPSADFRPPSKPSTQADVESEWFLYWCRELALAPLPARKLWEFAFILQSLHSRHMLAAGKRFVGFGCGTEPLPSYFAAQGVEVVATDLAPDEVVGKGWAETRQHTANLETLRFGNLVDADTFARLVTVRYVDMNKVPSEFNGQFDVSWSVCALEHLGSIENGMKFVLESAKCLRKGGVLVHTTEFNFTDDVRTIDHAGTVLYQRRHFLEIADRLRDGGLIVDDPVFDVGDRPLDKLVDLPPYPHDMTAAEQAWLRPQGHLKLDIEGFPATCFGLVAAKP